MVEMNSNGGMSFFTLFGCRIAVPLPPPQHDQESDDVGPSDDLSRAIVAVDKTEPEASSSSVPCPQPLRWYNPNDNCMHDYSSSSSSTTAGASKPKRKYQKRKRPDDSERVRRQRRRTEPQQPRRDLSPEFLSEIGPARPVFLYRKRLEMSDVDRRQNRLLVNETEKLKGFLTEEEMGKSKVDVTAVVDGQGREEYKLTLSKWGKKDEEIKKKSVVFHKQWNLMLRNNGVEIDDSVDVWGFRRGSTNEFCLAVAFSRG